MPAGWSDEIRTIQDIETPKGETMLTLMWHYSMDGQTWHYFYAYALEVYLHTHQKEPAMVYQRRSAQPGTAFVPVMTLLFDETSGIATLSSKQWCTSMLE